MILVGVAGEPIGGDHLQNNCLPSRPKTMIDQKVAAEEEVAERGVHPNAESPWRRRCPLVDGRNEAKAPEISSAAAFELQNAVKVPETLDQAAADPSAVKVLEI